MNEEAEVFMCGVNFQHHLAGDSHGTRVYPSIDDLKAHQPCWPQCGIVAVKVSLDRWVADQDFSRELPAPNTDTRSCSSATHR